ncbi:hypothetical protein D3C80_2227860 [compost metagenome]
MRQHIAIDMGCGHPSFLKLSSELFGVLDVAGENHCFAVFTQFFPVRYHVTKQLGVTHDRG